MLKTALVQHLVAIIVLLSPPGRQSFVPEAQETATQAQERYEQIAASLVDVAYAPTTKPLFSGPRGRLRTLALVASIAYHESGFRRDVDLGLGRARLGKSGWNDHGRSWCMMQVHLGKRTLGLPDGTTVETSAAMTQQGWSGLELLQDREKCFTAGLEVIRLSLGSCAKLPEVDRLSAYASGTCDRGASYSRTRMRGAYRIFDTLVAKGVPADAEVSSQP